MVLMLSLLILFILIATFSYLARKKRQPKSNLVTRFRKKFKSESRHREKLVEKVADILMADPDSNIQIGAWDREEELREKADIHRTRLSKYGHSKLNGEKFFMEKDGQVFKYTNQGTKKYV